MLVIEHVLFELQEYHMYLVPLAKWRPMASHVLPEDPEQAEAFEKALGRMCNDRSFARFKLNESFQAWKKVLDYAKSQLAKYTEEQKKYKPDDVAEGIIHRPWSACQAIIDSSEMAIKDIGNALILVQAGLDAIHDAPKLERQEQPIEPAPEDLAFRVLRS